MQVLFDSARRFNPATFGAGIVPPASRRTRKADGPSPEDAAWDEGYTLGYSMTPACAPARLGVTGRAAWHAGYFAGRTRATAEHEREYNAWLDAMAADHADYLDALATEHGRYLDALDDDSRACGFGPIH